MKNQGRKFNRLNLIILLVIQAILLLVTAHVDAQTILNNNKLRMGNGSENSVNTSGNLQQPFYYNSVQTAWRKLTYSVYPLDNAFAIGGDKTNEWNLNGTIVQNPTLSNQVINTSGFTVISGNNGYGTIVSKGNITIGGSMMEVENTYTLPQNSAYIEVKVKVKNVSAANVENVRIWIGTRDDWVGSTDQPRKQKGNLVDGAFQMIPNASTRSAALKVSTADEGILFYTNSDKGNTIIQGCCQWQGVINQNPSTSLIDRTHDGSYGFYVRMNDLAVGASDDFTWYYAAGELADLDEIIGEVASVSGSIADITSSSASFKATSNVAATGYWMVVPRNAAAPTAGQIKAGINYGSVEVTKSGSGSMDQDVEVTFNMTNLTPSTSYDFYFVTEDGTPQYSDVYNTQFATRALPTISSINDVTVCQDVISGTISFTIGDLETPAANLTVSAISSNTTLLPNANISFDGSGANRNFTVSPAAGQNGASEVTVTVTDADDDITTSTFTVNVTLNDTESPIVADIDYYLNAVANDLSAQATGNGLLWYENAVGGSGSEIAPTPSTSLVKSLEYWVSQTVGGCESERSKITVNVLFPNELTGSSESKPSFFNLHTIVDNQITISGTGTLANPKVYFASGYQAGDILKYEGTLPGGVSKSFNAATGVLSFTGTASVTTWENIFKNVLFTTTSTDKADRVITFILADGVSLNINSQPHYYQYIPGNITWSAAKTAAEGKIFFGLPGYLVTSTSLEENDFIKEKLSSDGWIGGSDDYNQINAALGTNTFVNQSAAEGNWYWVTGPEKGTPISMGNTNPVAVNEAYMNWNPGEPNNSGGEHYMQLYSVQNGRWNDLNGSNLLNGYVVEFGGYEGGPAPKIEHSRTLSFNSEAGITLSNATIDEELESGSGVGTLDVSGADEGLTFSYQLIIGTGSEDNNSFSIDGKELKTAAILDFEVKEDYAIRIQVTDNYNAVYQHNFIISLNNLNDNKPVITPGQSFDIDENSTAGTVVDTLVATDPDGETTFSNWTIVSGNTDNAFSIDPSTGEITVANPLALDYEETTGFTLTITVSDGENTSETEEVVINLNNLNDTKPAITASQILEMDENSLTGTVVGIVEATDPDGATTYSSWTIISGNDENTFAIDANTGEVSVVNSSILDYEEITAFTLVLSVSDGVNTSENEEITINLMNLNDNKPVITASQSFDLDENSPDGTTFGTVEATDADGETTYGSWTIISGNTGTAFAIDPSTGELSVADADAIDFETIESYTLTLSVSDGLNTSETETVVVNLNNLNDTKPVITASQVYNIDENSAIGTVVAIVEATDADGETTFSNWTIVSGNIGNAFAIDPETGEISVADASVLDYEVIESFNLVLTVYDGENTSETEEVVINLNNLNDTKPVITSGQEFTIDENTPNGTVVGTLLATDADGETTYSDWTIVSGNTGNAFSINTSTGTVTIANVTAADYEIQSSFTLVISVSDGINTSETEEVVINLNNLNDIAPVIAAGQSFNVDENSSTGTVAGSVIASDADGETTFVNWVIAGGNTAGAFAINAVTGEITVANSEALDFETITLFKLVIRVSDGTNTSDATEVIITLNNLNDNPPVIAAGQVIYVTENSNKGTLLGTLLVSDPDGSTTYTNWEITGGNSEDAFAIDPITGKIIVNHGAALDFEGIQIFTLTISVSDGIHTVEQTFTFKIMNENDHEPTDILLSNNSIKESEMIGTEVGSLTSIDLDGEDFHTYSLVSGSGDTGNHKFTINGDKLLTAGGFNYDHEKSLTIRVRTTDDGGLYFEKSFTILLEADTEINMNIPTAFSPNGDHANDTWEIDRLLSYPKSIVKVYNNDGNEVFSNIGYTKQWDGTYKGKDLAFGTYYYIIKLNDASGKVFKGTVMILK